MSDQSSLPSWAEAAASFAQQDMRRVVSKPPNIKARISIDIFKSGQDQGFTEHDWRRIFSDREDDGREWPARMQTLWANETFHCRRIEASVGSRISELKLAPTKRRTSNESLAHLLLKGFAAKWLENLGCAVTVEDGVVDVVGRTDNETIAMECGSTPTIRLLRLLNHDSLIVFPFQKIAGVDNLFAYIFLNRLNFYCMCNLINDFKAAVFREIDAEIGDLDPKRTAASDKEAV